jgi:hypothetical protein
MWERVGCGEPSGCVEVLLYGGDLRVEGFGDEEVGTGEEIFDEALCW